MQAMHRKKTRSIKSHLSLGSRTDAISPFLSFLPHTIPARPKLLVSFDLCFEVWPICTQYSGSKQHGRVIPNSVAKEIKILNGKLWSLPTLKLRCFIDIQHVTE